MAQVDVNEVTKDAIVSPSLTALGRTTTSANRPKTFRRITSASTGVTSKSGAAVKKLFSKLADLFYDRFKKEDVIDARRKADFIKNGIPNAPPLTEAEEDMIAKLMGEVEVMEAKRIAGTVNEPVEKFLHRDEKGGAAWGMSVARMDVAAIALFTEVSECDE